MTKPRVSVVIPAYNAAWTVERTVRNVLTSSIPLDVWVVDDGSTDETGAILDRLRAQVEVGGGGSRLFVIHQPNAGAYMARLNALKQIETTWFGFVDADDAVEPDMFAKMLAFAERESCDVVQCGVEGVDEIVLGAWYARLKAEAAGGTWTLLGHDAVVKEFIQPHLVKGQGSSFIWNKLYRNQYDFARFVTFERLTNFDDMILNFQFFEKVRRMGFLPEKLYHYATTAGSATHSYGVRQFSDFRDCVRFRRARGISRFPWYWLNLRSSLLSLMRSGLPLSQKCFWGLRLLGTCWS